MVSRRRFIQAAAAGVAITAAPTILVPITSARGLPAAAPAAQSPGTLVVGMVAEPTSLDPGQLTDINSMKLLGALYDTLVRFKPNSFELDSGLALSWDLSSDGMTY